LGHGAGAPAKKLKAVAAALAGVGDGKSVIGEETIAEAKAMGVSEESLAKLRSRNVVAEEDQPIEVEPENVDAVRVFLAAQTQWRMQPLSNGKYNLLARTGLDYAVLPVICTALCITPGEVLLDQLRTLEGETLRLYALDRARIFSS
jgi:hypothetical protein